MAIITRCPNCRAKFRLGEELVGKAVRCQACGEKFTVKAEEAAEAVTSKPEPKPAVGTPVDEDDDRPRKRDRDRDRDRDDDYDDEPRRRRKPAKSGSNTLLIVGGILVGIFLVCGGIAAVVGFFIMRTAQHVQVAANDFKMAFNDMNFNDGMPVNDPNFAKAPVINVNLDPKGGVFTNANSLLPGDTRLSGRPAKVYQVNMEQGKTYHIDLIANNSQQMDAFLRLVDPQNVQVAVDDDGGGNLNSRIVFTARQTGPHKIIATCLFFHGQPNMPYTLTVRRQ
jgi:predicted Zn finger-like uncharacterized protein